MDSKRHDKHLRSDTTSSEKSEENKPSSTVAVGESSDNLEFSCLSGKSLAELEKESHRECVELESRKYLKDHEIEDPESVVDDKNVEALKKKLPKDIESKVSVCDSEITDAKVTNGSIVTVNGSDIKFRNHTVGESVGASNAEQESKQTDVQLENGENKVASRSAASKKRTRSLSPGSDVDNGEKRPAAICSFYAKGWCIKGSSCSFLHIKDDAPTSSDQHLDEDVDDAYLKRQAQLGEGQKYSADTLKSPVLHHSLDSSFKNKSSFSSKMDLSSEKILSRDFTESQGWDVLHDKNKFLLHHREDVLMSTLPDCQKFPSTNFGPSYPSNRSSSMSRNGLPPEIGLSSGGFVKLFSNHNNGTPSSWSGVMEQLANVASPRSPNDHSPKLKNINLPMSGISSRFSTSSVSSYPFMSASLSSSLLGTQKMSTVDREHHVSTSASLLRNSSPFAFSKSENSLTNRSMNYSESKMKHSSCNWEPSVPFRPSFIIPSINVGSQYDPFLDSIEVPRIVDGSYNASFNSQGHQEMSTLSSLHRASGNFIVPGSSGPELNDDTSSLSSRNKANENKNDKICYVHSKALPTVEAERQGSRGIDVNNGSGTREEDVLGLVAHEKNVMKTKKMDVDNKHRLQNVALHEKDSEADSERRLSDMDAKHLMDGDFYKESKAIRHFRAALIELVKELLKPKWREGHLKKEVHNTVVKKTLDKVLGTLQSHQIPTTAESVKQYLSSSRPKIAKLVEGYVSKYGKS